MRVFGKTDVGLVRRINEDFLYYSRVPVGAFPNLFIVADGMGGHRGGNGSQFQAQPPLYRPEAPAPGKGRHMIRRVLEWLFPRKCVLCRAFLGKEETDLCRACRVDQPEYRYGKKKVPHISDLTAVWMYQGHAASSLKRYKFSNARHYAPVYGRLLAMRIARDLPRADLITWVPVSAKRLRQRGYDQVELIAKAVGAELGITTVPVLKKIRNGEPVTQNELDELAKLVLIQNPNVDIRALKEFYPQATASLDKLLRTIIGMDSDAVEVRFAQFAADNSLTSQQLRFLSLLKNHIRDYGTIEMRQLFEQPFTHIHNEGVTGVFPDIEQIARLQKIVEELGVVTDAATV